MPRIPRGQIGGVCLHVINRGNGRATVFHKPQDYQAFVELIGLAGERTPMRVLAYCLMPNHFHLVVWPRAEGDISRWMQWLMTSHVRRYHRHYRTSGHVWQGRFKSFPIERDRAHLWTAMSYVESNPRRAGLVKRAEDWRWSSLRPEGRGDRPEWLHAGPAPRPTGWVGRVNAGLADSQLDRIRRSVTRGRPFGSDRWTQRVALRLGLDSTLRPCGRPRKPARTEK